MKIRFPIVFLILFAAVLLSFGSTEGKASSPVVNDQFSSAYKEANLINWDDWELPVILKDVSGIKYVGDNRFACLQGAVGTIFIYNSASGEIEKEIPFSGPGDFEGIAIAGTTAYTVKSDGNIYEVQDYEGAKPIVKQYATFLTAKHHVEGLAYDKKNNRLLLAINGNEPGTTGYKGIYAFNLKTRQLAGKPVIKIHLNDPYIKNIIESTNAFLPSAIEIHPVTHEIYILLGTGPKLLVMNAKGRITKLYTFNRSDLPQAEGLAFTPAGELFISNEGTNGASTIVKVNL